MTELVWPGKYDNDGSLRTVERTILSFQAIGTVNEATTLQPYNVGYSFMPKDTTCCVKRCV